MFRGYYHFRKRRNGVVLLIFLSTDVACPQVLQRSRGWSSCPPADFEPLEDSLVSSPSTCPWGSGIQIPRSYSTEIFLCEDLYMRCGWKIPSIGWEELSSAQWTKMKRVSFIKRLRQDPWELGRNWGVVQSGVLSQSWPMLVKVLLSLTAWRTSQSWRRSADSHFT